MITLSWFIIITTLWFLVLVFLRSKLPWKFCAACVAISSSWLALLVFYFINKAANPLLTVLLMGESVVGLYYLLEKKVPDAWQIFRWPYLMTGTALVYLIFDRRSFFTSTILILVLWIFFGIIFVARNNQQVKKYFERLIACCRDW